MSTQGKWRNIKVHVPTEEISKKVQEALFKDGCSWIGDGTQYWDVIRHASGIIWVNKSGVIYSGVSDPNLYKSTNWQDIVSGTPEGGFQVGDKVTAWGLEGTVVKLSNYPSEINEYSIRVNFENGRESHFTSIGKYSSWHKDISLKFLSRPPKTEKRKFYVWSLDGRLQTTLMDDQHRDVLGNTLATPCGELKKIEGTETVLEVVINK